MNAFKTWLSYLSNILNDAHTEQVYFGSKQCNKKPIEIFKGLEKVFGSEWENDTITLKPDQYHVHESDTKIKQITGGSK